MPRTGYEDKLNAEVLKEHLNKYVDAGLIASWSVPDYYVCVDEIPKTSVGKQDKKLLRTRYATARQ